MKSLHNEDLKNLKYIADILTKENPQIVVSILSYVRPRIGAEILKCFDSELQSTLVEKIAMMDNPEPLYAREINNILGSMPRDYCPTKEEFELLIKALNSVDRKLGREKGMV